MNDESTDAGGAPTGASGTWDCGSRVFDLATPLVMGILNVTPDSFSDGGRFVDPDAACAHARRMRDDGAAIIDVGGESTRPGSDPVTEQEEIARVLPVVRRLAAEGMAVSIDTRNPGTAAACVEAGACIINDVSGFRDPRMVDLAARTDVGLVVMHMLGEPGTMQHDPSYADVVAEVAAYLEARASELEAAGVARSRICVDPGIGFGKTLAHNLELLRNTVEFGRTGRPVLIGASRKRLIGEVLGIDEPTDRLEGSLAIAAWSVANGADIVRVHDVAETVRVVRMTTSIATSGNRPL